MSKINSYSRQKRKRCVFLLFYEVLLVEPVTLESVALVPLSFICPLISPSGWSWVFRLTYTSPFAIAVFKSAIVFPAIDPFKLDSVTLPLIVIPFGLSECLLTFIRSTTISPFSPAFPLWILTPVASFAPVTFIFQVNISFFVLKFITPSAVEFTAGTSLFPSSFALYFSFCAYVLFAAARTKEL